MKNCGKLRAICSVRLEKEELTLKNCAIFKHDDSSIYFRLTNDPANGRNQLVIANSKAKLLSLQKEFAIALNEFRIDHKKINLYMEGHKWNKLIPVIVDITLM
jgi:hypothetical protein